MPFCARCFGCSIGHVLAFGLFLIGSLPTLLIASIGMSIMFLDWLIQSYFNLTSNNYSRFVTGIMGGGGVGVFIWTFVGIGLKHIFGI
jgi:uncharacterized membrane protein